MTLQRLAPVYRNRTAQEYVVSALREALVDGTLKAGEKLIQSELAERFQVSITPVREALRDLAAEGLVEISPNRGTVVRTLDLNEVREIYELRITLEPLMIKRVIHSVSEGDLKNASNLHCQMARVTDLTEWAELNREFHQTFSESREQSRLAKILDQLRVSSSQYVSLSLGAHPERIVSSNEEHAQLIALYRQRDVAAVTALTIQHLQSTLTDIEGSYPRHPPG